LRGNDHQFAASNLKRCLRTVFLIGVPAWNNGRMTSGVALTPAECDKRGFLFWLHRPLLEKAATPLDALRAYFDQLRADDEAASASTHAEHDSSAKTAIDQTE
jgi:hypothetical protein